MEQLVRVQETFDDGTAMVVHVRESACSGDCHKCSGCGAAKETILLKAKNPIGARRGDLVKLESETGPVLKAAAMLYVLPMLLFFLGYSFFSFLKTFFLQNFNHACPTFSSKANNFAHLLLLANCYCSPAIFIYPKESSPFMVKCTRFIPSYF